MRHSKWYAYKGGGEDSDQESAFDVLDEHDGCNDYSDNSQKCRAGSELAEAYQCGVVVDDDAGALKSDEGYVESDARTDGFLECVGNHFYNLFS